MPSELAQAQRLIGTSLIGFSPSGVGNSSYENIHVDLSIGFPGLGIAAALRCALLFCIGGGLTVKFGAQQPENETEDLEMSLLGTLFGRRKQEEVFDPNPGVTSTMPARPYRILHTNLPFYSDAECRNEVKGARLLVLRCEDPRQPQQVVECMPTTKTYSPGLIVAWDLNNKAIWDTAYYKDPETGKPGQAWSRAVEFVGPLVKVN
jgi:hypothetical protein